MESALSHLTASPWLFLLLAVPMIIWAVDFWIRLSHDPREPPRVNPSVPLVGHLLGFAKTGQSYYDEIDRGRSEDETFISVPLFGRFKIYVLKTVSNIRVIQRNAKFLSLNTLHAMMAQKFADASPRTMKTFNEACSDDAPEHNILRDQHANFGATLAPGPDLDSMNELMAGKVTEQLDTLMEQAQKQGEVCRGLLAWTRSIVTAATTEGIYGPANPFRDEAVVRAFWIFDDNLPVITKGYPKWLYPAPHKARMEIAEHFSGFYKSGDWKGASKYVRERYEILRRYGLSFEEICKFEIITASGALSNSVPSLFEFLFDIFSRPELVAELRQEVEQVVSRGDDDQEADFVLDVVGLRRESKLLLSTFQEMQRYYTRHSVTRRVAKDLEVDDGSTLLKSGNWLQIPSHIMHHKKTIWGPTADEFDPHRFIKLSEKAQSDGKVSQNGQILPTGSYLGWGIAPHMCPGRHFITTEIMILVALLLLRFDIEAADGQWIKPEANRIRLLAILPPKTDLNVKFKPRAAWQGRWKLKMGNSKYKLPLASG